MISRQNPFSSRNVESLSFQGQGVRFDAIMERLNALDYRAAIIGPKGSGKTTLLETIAAELQKDGFEIFRIIFNDANRKLNGHTLHYIPKNRRIHYAFLVDGAEQLSWLSWKRLCFHTKNAKCFLITAHQETSLPTLIRTATSAALLADLVRQLAGERHMPQNREIERLFSAHHGNIRLALRALYDIWADK